MIEIQGFILAGGASSRMGTNKSYLKLGGKTFLDRSISALSFFSPHLYIVGGSANGLLSLPVLPDIYKCGESRKKASIFGLHTALSKCGGEWAAVLACDLPFVTGELFKRLVALGRIREKSNLDAVVPVQPDGKLQPLCALYSRSTFLPRIEKMLDAGDYRLRGIFAGLSIRMVTHEEIKDLNGAENFFLNINTPEDFNAARDLQSASLSD